MWDGAWDFRIAPQLNLWKSSANPQVIWGWGYNFHCKQCLLFWKIPKSRNPGNEKTLLSLYAILFPGSLGWGITDVSETQVETERRGEVHIFLLNNVKCESYMWKANYTQCPRSVGVQMGPFCQWLCALPCVVINAWVFCVDSRDIKSYPSNTSCMSLKRRDHRDS